VQKIADSFDKISTNYDDVDLGYSSYREMFLRQIYEECQFVEKVASELQDSTIYKEFQPKRQLKT
jgi:hypothetical protein